jgi:hypothetical protein
LPAWSVISNGKDIAPEGGSVSTTVAGAQAEARHISIIETKTYTIDRYIFAGIRSSSYSKKNFPRSSRGNQEKQKGLLLPAELCRISGVGVLASDGISVKHSGAAASDSHRLAIQLSLTLGHPIHITFLTDITIEQLNKSSLVDKNLGLQEVEAKKISVTEMQ